MDAKRRALLKGMGGAAAYRVLSPLVGAASFVTTFAAASFPRVSEASPGSAIATENAKPGTLDWCLGSRVGGVQYFRSDDERNQIVGYAAKTSAAPLDTLDLYISVNASAPAYTIEVFRLGYYQGCGARLVQRIDKTDGRKQITDDHSSLLVDDLTGRVQCGWSVSHTLDIGADWPSGIYLARLTNADRYQGHIVFCVRSASAAPSGLLYVQPTLTYQAYNGYPFVTSPSFKFRRVGRSLYPVPSISCATSPNAITGCCEAVAVSYDRPYTSMGSYVGNVGNGAAFDSYTYEPYFIRWAEQNGYALDYVTDLDIDAQGISLLERYQGVVFPGHFEYWTKNIRDAIEQAKNQSVHLAFLGANAAYYQVRLENSAKNPGKTVVCYKGAGGKGRLGDPLAGTLYETTLFANVGRFDSMMSGLSHAVAGTGDQILPLRTVNTNHWVWQGAGVQEGDSIPALLGYEVDVKGATLPFSRTGSYTLLCDSSYLGRTSNASIYQAYSGGWVFTAGTMSWCWGLSNPITYDGQPPSFFGKTIPASYQSPAVCRATKNLLDTFLADERDHRRRTDLAFVRSDKSIWVRELGASGWQSPVTLNGATVFEPAWLSRATGEFDVVVTSQRGCLWVRSRRSGQWQPWQPLSGENAIVGSASVVTAAGGGVEVFALDGSGHLAKRSCAEGVVWSNWEVIGEKFREPPTAINCGDITEVFGIGPKRELLTTTMVNGVPGLGWTSLGGEVGVGRCGAAVDGAGLLLAAVVGTEGALWTRMRSTGNGQWGSWVSLGGVLGATPVVVSPYPGRFDIIAKLRNGSIAGISCVNGRWGGWTSYGGIIVDEPKVAVVQGGMVVHGMGADGGKTLWALSIATSAATTAAGGSGQSIWSWSRVG